MSGLSIKPVRRNAGGNTFCGPAVVSSVCGVTTCAAAAVMRRLSGRRSIKGVSRSLLTRAFAEFGVAMTSVGRHDGAITLARWLKLTPRPAGVVYVVLAGHHWQLVSGRRFVCGVTREIVSVLDPKVRRRARVAEAWVLTRADDRTPPEVTKPPARTTGDPVRNRCRRLAAKLGCAVEWDAGIDARWVYGPDAVYADPPAGEGRPDPIEGYHVRVGWGEVYTALREYEADLNDREKEKAATP